jgi:hypothetical protein
MQILRLLLDKPLLLQWQGRRQPLQRQLKLLEPLLQHRRMVLVTLAVNKSHGE